MIPNLQKTISHCQFPQESDWTFFLASGNLKPLSLPSQGCIEIVHNFIRITRENLINFSVAVHFHHIPLCRQSNICVHCEFVGFTVPAYQLLSEGYDSWIFVLHNCCQLIKNIYGRDRQPVLLHRTLLLKSTSVETSPKKPK